eukprot:1907559-Rhodomonas_salina.2
MEVVLGALSAPHLLLMSQVRTGLRRRPDDDVRILSGGNLGTGICYSVRVVTVAAPKRRSTPPWPYPDGRRASELESLAFCGQFGVTSSTKSQI